MGCNEVSLEEAWALLASTSNAALVDVRTEAEWDFVGVPDLTALGNEVQRIEWNRYPGGVPNEAFTAQVGERLAGVGWFQEALERDGRAPLTIAIGCRG